jgi:hypothetical protein
MWPFSYNSASRELLREIQAGNKNCYLKRKWYGWIVVHEKIKE